jgi:DNA-binding transcriptional ArsR family regulator
VDKFAALADPTRRKIVELLARAGRMPASEISEHFPVSPQAISQHLKILREAKLVLVDKRAQQRIYRVNPIAVRELEEWAMRIVSLWNRRYEVLDRSVEEAESKEAENE